MCSSGSPALCARSGTNGITVTAAPTARALSSTPLREAWNFGQAGHPSLASSAAQSTPGGRGRSPLADLAYETRADGVLYELGHGLKVKVQRKGANRVKVTMQREEIFIPPETGDLDTGAFRSKLVSLARERFGEVNGLADELGLVAVAFETHLEEREKDAAEDDEQTNVPELVGTPYRIVGAGFVRLKNTREGEIPQRLTNFTAQVEEEVVKDDGAEVRRVYRVAGRAGDKPLPKTDVPAAQFGAMNWVHEAWGLSARITAVQGARDCTREAIELCSQGARVRHV